MKRFNENITQVTKALQALLDEENLQSFKEILIDIRHVTRILATNTEQINTIIRNSAEASAQFVPSIKSGEEILRTMNNQILPAVSKAMLNLEIITNNLSAVSREIKDNPAVIIRGKTEQPLGPGEK